MAARSKAWVCDRSNRSIAGSSPGTGVDVSDGCWVLSSIGLSDGPIPLPEESCRVWCVVYDLKISTLRRPRPELGCCATGGKNYSRCELCSIVQGGDWVRFSACVRDIYIQQPA